MREPSVVASRPALSLRQSGPLSLLRWSLQALWFVITPLTMSGVILRYLTPYSVTVGGFEAAFAGFAYEHTLLLALSLFVSLAALLRYWRAFLPGGRYLFALPLALVERVPRRRLALCEAAVAELAGFASAGGKKMLARTDPAILTQIISAEQQLREQLFAGKWSQVGRALHEFQASKKLASSARQRWKGLVFALAIGAVALLALQVRAHFFQAYQV